MYTVATTDNAVTIEIIWRKYGKIKASNVRTTTMTNLNNNSFGDILLLSSLRRIFLSSFKQIGTVTIGKAVNKCTQNMAEIIDT